MSNSNTLNQNEQFVRETLSLAKQAAREDEVPVGAVVVQEGVIIGRGYNKREHGFDPTAHAEILAIREAATVLKTWRLEGCVLYVTLEPCPMCLAAAQLARVSKVVYLARDPKGGALSLGYRINEDPHTNHRFPVEYFEQKEASEILTEFFKRKRTEKMQTA